MIAASSRAGRSSDRPRPRSRCSSHRRAAGRSRARTAPRGASPGAARSPPCAAATDRARGTAARRRSPRSAPRADPPAPCVRYQRSATCNSLEGSHSRPITRIAITSAQATASRPRRHQPAAQLIELQRPPQRPAQPHRPEAARALQTHLIELDRNRGARARRLRTARRCETQPRPPDDAARQRCGSRAPLRIELAQLRHRLLHHLAAAAHRAHQPPVDVRLAVFASCRVPQVHARIVGIAHAAAATHLVATTRAFCDITAQKAPRSAPPT